MANNYWTHSNRLARKTAVRAEQMNDILDAVEDGFDAIPALSNNYVQIFTAAGGDFTAGVTTSLTLSAAPDSENVLEVMFDGVVQAHDTYSVSGTTLTFSSAITAGTAKVECVWNNTVSYATGGSLAITATGSTESRTLSTRFADIYHSDDFGVTGDGSADDTTYIQAFLTACEGGIGIAGSDKEFAVNGQITIPSNVRILGRLRIKIVDDASITGNTNAVLCGTNFHCDELEISLATGQTIDRIVQIDDNSIIKKIKVTSTDQINNRTDVLDGAIQIRGDNIEIGRIEVSNFDNAVVAYQVNNLSIDYINISSYVRGVFLNEVSNWNIRGGNVYTASSNASTTAGHNGVLMQQVTDGAMSNFVVENSGEHAYRIGSGTTAGSNHLAFSNIIAKLSGQCGFKINDSSYDTENVSISNLLVVDCAATSAAGSNEDGLRLEHCKDVTVTGFRLARKTNSGSSAYDGIYINDSLRISINSLEMADTANHGIHIVDTDGQSRDITISGVKAQGITGDLVHVASPTENLQNIVVDITYGRDITGYGVYVECNATDGSGVPDPCVFSGDIHNAGSGIFGTNNAGATRLYYNNLTQRN